MAALEDRALRAAAVAADNETRLQAARHFAAIRLLRTERVPQITHDEGQERSEGTARYLERRLGFRAEEDGSSRLATDPERVLRNARLSGGDDGVRSYYAFLRFYETGAAITRLLDLFGIDDYAPRIEAGMSPAQVLVDSLGIAQEEVDRLVDDARAAYDPEHELPALAVQLAAAAAEEDWEGPGGVSYGGSCLRGDIAPGFSLVVHAGGPLDGLEDCARVRGVTALYALRGGRYVPWIAGAPGFVNEPFAELWEPAAHGEPAAIPAGTPLLAASAGPPSADRLPGPAIPAWPGSRCLHGELLDGFSLVIYEGGDVEALAACARQLSVDAVYVLAAGEWVPYIVDAPDFVNRPFAKLFAEGLPFATPLVVRGAAGE